MKKVSAKLYRNCEELPLRVFFLARKDLKYLCYEGDVTDEELEKAWIDILDEFNELTGNAAKNQDTINQIKYLESCIMIITSCVTILSVEEDEEVHNTLLKFVGSVDKIENRINSYSLRIKSLIKQIEKDQDEKEQSFDDVMADLYSHGFQNISDDISVSRYVAIKKIIKNGIRKAKDNIRSGV